MDRGPAVIGVLIVAALVVLAGVGAWWWLQSRRLEWAIDRGLLALQGVQRSENVGATLRAWETETAPYWSGREEPLLKRLLARGTSDTRVRQLISWIADADYGDRAEDWKRWQDAVLRDKKRRGSATVALHPRWRARVGATAWFSTILPLDGQIFVASLGTRFDEPGDPWDGLIRVDGTTGESEYIFESPDAPPGDVVGLAAGGGMLVVACRNGYVYGISPRGELQWRAAAGARIGSGVLLFDAARGGPLCAAVATEAGKLVVLNTAGGKPLWTAALPVATSAALDDTARESLPRPLMSFALALGDFSSDPGSELLAVNLAGQVRVLSTSNGRVRWQGAMSAGSVGGIIGLAPRERAEVGAGADLHGTIWVLSRSQRGLALSPQWELINRGPSGITAPLRVVGGPGQELLLASSSGGSGKAGAALATLNVAGTHWRRSVRGRVWAGPAVADLNADRQPEFVVASNVVASDGALSGVLSVLSNDGHVLREEQGTAAFESPPVVADVDGDGKNEVLIADAAGILHCFATERSGAIEWGVSGGDAYNTRNAGHAYSFGQSPFGYQWRWRPE